MNFNDCSSLQPLWQFASGDGCDLPSVCAGWYRMTVRPKAQGILPAVMDGFLFNVPTGDRTEHWTWLELPT